MSGGWQISVGDVYETMRPALFGLAALSSVLVLADARRHGGFRAYAVWSWTLSAFFSPPVVLPLYLVARMFTRRPAPTASTPDTDSHDSTEDAARTEVEQGVEQGSDEESAPRGGTPYWRRFAPPVLYAAALALAGTIYFYMDYRSFDGHLARAEREKLYGRREPTISAYRAALGVRDDAHTRKLLGLELLQAGRAEESLAELRAAERGGEPDERLSFRLAAALDALDRRDEAADAYRRFSQSRLCSQSPPDDLCDKALARLQSLTAPPN